MIEGDDVAIHQGGKKRGGAEAIETINTKDILFILGGAFVGIQQQMNKVPIGIERIGSSKQSKISTQALIKYGMIPELVGRVPVVVQTDSLGIEQLVKILTEPRDSLVKQYQCLLAIDGIKLVFAPDFLETVAQLAIKQKTGARGLRAIMEASLMDLMYTAPDQNKKTLRLKEVILTAKDVKE
jgi:ATP-dependent Clp protease ATP-binding subunit ClpX